MSHDDDFRVRVGRIRDKGRAHQVKPFMHRVLGSVEKAGGFSSHQRRLRGRSTFGRGRIATVQANRHLTSRSRSVIVKARVVRHRSSVAPLITHLAYLRREGVEKDGLQANLFDAAADHSNATPFADRCAGDRHHFRFIVLSNDCDNRKYARVAIMHGFPFPSLGRASNSHRRCGLAASGFGVNRA